MPGCLRRNTGIGNGAHHQSPVHECSQSDLPRPDAARARPARPIRPATACPRRAPCTLRPIDRQEIGRGAQLTREPSIVPPSAIGAATRTSGWFTAAMALFSVNQAARIRGCKAQQRTRSRAEPFGPTTRSTPPQERSAAAGRAWKPTSAIVTAATPSAPTKTESVAWPHRRCKYANASAIMRVISIIWTTSSTFPSMR